MAARYLTLRGIKEINIYDAINTLNSTVHAQLTNVQGYEGKNCSWSNTLPGNGQPLGGAPNSEIPDF